MTARTNDAPPWSWLVVAPGTDGCPSSSPRCECHRNPVRRTERWDDDEDHGPTFWVIT